jgi:hypothetical protein
LIFNDDWTNFYISRMNLESQYMPNIIRSLFYNQSIHLYVLLSKIAGLFTLKYFINSFLIANIYPFAKGLSLDLKDWNKSKTLLVLYVLLIMLGMVASRAVDLVSVNTIILLSPFLTYFILIGLTSINNKIYLVLFVISIFIATSP